MAKYSSPHWPSALQAPARGSSPSDCSSGAFDVVLTYFRSAAFSSLAWMKPLVTDPPQAGSAPLLACSSKPATSDWIAVEPEPWWTPVPLSASDVVWMAPAGMSRAAAWVIVEAGRGAEETGTRRVRPASAGVNSSRPLASARNSRGRPLWVESMVESIVLVSLVGSIVSVSVTVADWPAATVTWLGETE